MSDATLVFELRAMPATTDARVLDRPGAAAPTTLKAYVYNMLRDAIVSGRFKPGQRLNESQLAREFNISRASQATLPVLTQPGHMLPKTARAGSAATGGAKSFRGKDSETTLDGNSVVLEEEMLKMTDARMNYEAAIGFYQKSMNLLRMAGRAPGR